MNTRLDILHDDERRPAVRHITESPSLFLHEVVHVADGVAELLGVLGDPMEATMSPQRRHQPLHVRRTELVPLLVFPHVWEPFNQMLETLVAQIAQT